MILLLGEHFGRELFKLASQTDDFLVFQSKLPLVLLDGRR